MRFMATENGMTVWSAVFIIVETGREGDCSGNEDFWEMTPEPLPGDGLWVPPVHNVQNTVSHVSQNNNSYRRNVTQYLIW